MFDVIKPLNHRVLDYLNSYENSVRRKLRDSTLFAIATSVSDPYKNCGCHPDVVRWLWDYIGAALPTDCRGLIYGTPSLVHSRSGVIVAVGIGTAYALRLTESSSSEAKNKGLKTIITWSNGTTLDIEHLFGEGWYFGAWNKEERIWCQKDFEFFGEC